MTPEEWDYIPKREFLVEKFKAHDIMIPLLSEEEVQKLRDARDQSVQNQLALKMADAEVGYKKAQTMAQLTKAKEHNVKAVKDAQTPPEQPQGVNPELQNAEVQGVQTNNLAKEAEIRRAEEQHTLDLEHQQEQHHVGLVQETAKTAQDMELKNRTAEHGMQMKEKLTTATAKAKSKAAKEKSTVKKTSEEVK